MYFPTLESAHYSFLNSLVTISDVKLKNRLTNQFVTMDELRHECTNYDALYTNEDNNPQISELFQIYGADRVICYLKLIVNNKIAYGIIKLMNKRHLDGYQQIQLISERTEGLVIENDELRVRLITLETSHDNLSHKVTELNEKLQNNEAELKEVNECLQDLIDQALVPYKAESTTLNTEVSRLNSILDKQANIILKQSKRIRAQNKEIRALKAEIRALKAYIYELETKFQAQLEAQQAQLEAQQAQLEAQQAQLEAQQAQHEAQLDAMDKRINTLCSSQEEFSEVVTSKAQATKTLHRVSLALHNVVFPAHTILKVADPRNHNYSVRFNQLKIWLSLLEKKLTECSKFVDVTLELAVLNTVKAHYHLCEPKVKRSHRGFSLVS